jgi:hypothetical protein
VAAGTEQLLAAKDAKMQQQKQEMEQLLAAKQEEMGQALVDMERMLAENDAEKSRLLAAAKAETDRVLAEEKRNHEQEEVQLEAEMAAPQAPSQVGQEERAAGIGGARGAGVWRRCQSS